MLNQLLKLENWAKLAGFVLIFLSIIVCSFIYAISYPPPHGGSRQTQQLQLSEDRAAEKQEKLEQAANERSLTVATWALVLATVLDCTP
jgi:hypothetical protein